LNFPYNKNAPRGCDRMHKEVDCLQQSASGTQSGASLSR